jgi:hypothetical protein
MCSSVACSCALSSYTIRSKKDSCSPASSRACSYFLTCTMLHMSACMPTTVLMFCVYPQACGCRVGAGSQSRELLLAAPGAQCVCEGAHLTIVRLQRQYMPSASQRVVRYATSSYTCVTLRARSRVCAYLLHSGLMSHRVLRAPCALEYRHVWC